MQLVGNGEQSALGSAPLAWGRRGPRRRGRGGEGVGTVGAQVADGGIEHVVHWWRHLARHADPLARARACVRSHSYSHKLGTGERSRYVGENLKRD